MIRALYEPMGWFSFFFMSLGLLLCTMPDPVHSQVSAYRQAVAEAAASDRALAAFYRENDHAGLWTSPSEADKRRRQALFEAIAQADLHGLPPARYDADGLKTLLRGADHPRARGFAEVALTRAFLKLAKDMKTGLLTPARVVSGIKRETPEFDPGPHLAALARDNPRKVFGNLSPGTNEYTRLMKEKLRLEDLLARGGWGPPVQARALEPGQTGTGVVQLRDRLIAMGYLRRNVSASYDGTLQRAVQRFQSDSGLEPDGVAGQATLDALNTPVRDRLKFVLVAMERERWLPRDRGDRHILVNLADFTARILDHDDITFETRAVVGKNSHDRRSPEFSDEMDHMMINPTWHVPRSIAVNEYLPKMQSNPNAASYLRLVDSRGRVINRASVDFSTYTRRTFPFSLKQPPSNRNALGLVKFMFPNKYNIYLHDTPEKHLFARTRRAFSHGCIRLQDPFDFAYELLSRQESDPRAFFHSVLDTGRETRVNLEDPVPVHLIYRTAFTSPRGATRYRDDVYGRDALIWQALSQAGVSLPDVRG